ncbi:MFS transporter [Niveomyces insectorum RCEF 264]|uniref:MFS transporter n=1 Tax=Niveomyces insectorum RCEF 264 TaxID=1081102 RepID=A0A167XS35_9HYPO|nr:MFS transporter [Niveomyces insectorum RCEF 264]
MAIKLRGRPLYRLMKVVSGLSFCMYGFDAGVVGGMLLHKPFQDAMGNPTGVWIYPMIVASYDLAAFVTSIVIASFTMKIGRRGTIIMGNTVAVFGAVLQASSYSVAQMIVGRLLTGFAIGSISSAVPIYLSECGSKAHDRGPANCINAMFLMGGVPIAYWIDYGFVHWYAQASWRIPVILQCCFAIPAGLTMFFLPDTPRWYYARNKIEKGDAALSQLYDEEVDSAAVQNTKRSIMAAIEIELEANTGIPWSQFLTLGIVDTTKIKVVRRLVICFCLPLLGEWMGISLLAYFAPVILSGIGTSAGTVSVISGVLCTCMFLGTVPLYWTIEKFGRRSTMLYSAMVSSVLYVVFIVLVAVGGKGAQWASVVMLFLIVPVLSYGWQANKFLYGSEVAPLEYRHLGGAFFSSGEWLMVFITVFASPIGLDTCGWPFWFFILAGNVCAVVFVWLFCPETAGKTLEQVDYLFIGKGFAGLQRDRGPVVSEFDEKLDHVPVEVQSNI